MIEPVLLQVIQLLNRTRDRASVIAGRTTDYVIEPVLLQVVQLLNRLRDRASVIAGRTTVEQNT